jgi:hypothetical protein
LRACWRRWQGAWLKQVPKCLGCGSLYALLSCCCSAFAALLRTAAPASLSAPCLCCAGPVVLPSLLFSITAHLLIIPDSNNMHPASCFSRYCPLVPC